MRRSESCDHLECGHDGYCNKRRLRSSLCECYSHLRILKLIRSLILSIDVESD